MSDGLRFDDMMATVLAQPLLTENARITTYRQLVDLIAQGRGDCDGALIERAFERLEELKHVVPRRVRCEVARSLVGYRIPGRLLLLFADESAADVADLFARAPLDDAEWLGLLPKLTAPIRNILRNRRDLGEPVRQALEALGPADFVIPGPPMPELPSILPELSADMVAAYRRALEVAAEAVEAVHGKEEPPAAPRVEKLFEPSEIPAAPEAAEAEPVRHPALVSGRAQIRDLLHRIEAFRDRIGPLGRAEHEPPAEEQAELFVEEEAPREAAPAWPPPGDFRWESNAQGTICWVEGVAREPVIGRSIAVAALTPGDGVDMQVAGAFRKRAPFRDARLIIPGSSAASGEWRLSGVPTFDPRDGRFTGYRGTARRPQPWEIASVEGAPAPAPARREQPSADGLRQLAHELRSPLNAILGFAEMIEQQILGPAAADYRDRAATIVEEAQRLLTAIDDVDTLAKETGAPREAGLSDVGRIIEELVNRYRPLASERGLQLTGSIAPGLPGTTASPEAVERIVSRLFASVIGAAAAGEHLVYGARAEEDDRIRIFLARPAALVGRSEEAMLDPGSAGMGDGLEAPAIGLAFGLRLVRQLARALGGRLDIEDRLFALILPSRIGMGRATA